jgi:uncharacterized phage protein (TIGR01671 family)
MRQIKFRIYDTKRKEWLHDTEHAINLFGEIIMLGEMYMRPDGKSAVSIKELNDLVAMQFTGREDRYGNEIFEGDIIKPCNGHAPVEDFWDDLEASFEVLGDMGHLGDVLAAFPDSKVIGNVHDNPELLKV